MTGISDAAGLIRAIRAANNGGGTNTITIVPNTTITLTIADNGDPATGDRTGLPVITNNDLTINGNASTIVRNSNAEPFRIFSINSGATLRLNDLTLTGGAIAGPAGAAGTTSTDGGTGGAASGGALVNNGTFVAANVTFSGNTAIAGAGGNITVNGGRTGGRGGDALGGALVNHGTLTGTNIGFNGNYASGGTGGRGGDGPPGGNGGSGGSASGGALFNDGTLQLTHPSFTSNSSQPGMGGQGGDANLNVDDFGAGGIGGKGGAASGGAILLASGAATITQGEFFANSATGRDGGYGGDGEHAGSGGYGGDASGGALTMLSGNATITRSDFSRDATRAGGGGASGRASYVKRVYNDPLHVTYSDITYAGTEDEGGYGGSASGGAITISVGTATIEDSTFGGNSATGGNTGSNTGSGPGAYDGVSSLTGIAGQTGGNARGGAVSNAATLQFVGTSTDANTATGGIGGDGGPGAYITSSASDIGGWNGGTGGVGGAVHGGTLDNTGTLIVSRSSITGSRATGGTGGSGGSAGFCSSTAFCTTGGHGGDGATGGGVIGGAVHATGGITIANTTINDSRASAGNGGSGGYPTDVGYYCCSYRGMSGNGGVGGNGDGGAVMDELGSLDLTNSTVANNVASGGTGGIAPRVGDQYGTSGGYGTSSGGGVLNAGASTVTLANTIMLNSVADTGANCSGTISDGGHNLEFNPTNTCGLGTGTHDLLVDPKLPTNPTTCLSTCYTVSFFPLPYTSPARNAGDPAICAGGAVGGVDGRNKPRPAAHCDIGAFELQPASFLSPQYLPTDLDAGSALTLTIHPTTDWGYQDYSSAIHFICDDPVALCPADYTFGPTEQHHDFSFTPNTTGVQTVIMTDPTSATSPRTTMTFTIHPSLTSLDATSGPTLGGNTVTVTGVGFISAQSLVTINGQAVDATRITVLSGTSLTVRMPAHEYGFVNVGLLVRTIASRSTTSYSYYYATPTLISVSDTSGPIAGGNTVTITGTNFASNATSVTVNGYSVDAGTVTVVDDHTVRVVMPAHVPGVVQIGVQVSFIASATTLPYTYLYPPPTLTSLSDTSGPIAGGNTITMTGTFYDPYSTPPVVTLDGTAIATNLVSVQNDTTVRVTMPTHSAATVQIGVINHGVASTTTLPYTYVDTQPTLTSLSATSGSTAGNTPVTITGTHFVSGSTSVTIDGVAIAASAVTVVNDTTVRAIMPAHNAGIVQVGAQVNGVATRTTLSYTYGTVHVLPPTHPPGTPQATPPGPLPPTHPPGTPQATPPSPLPPPQP